MKKTTPFIDGTMVAVSQAGALKAIKEIAALAFTAGHQYGDCGRPLPNKEQFLSQLFPNG